MRIEVAAKSIVQGERGRKTTFFPCRPKEEFLAPYEAKKISSAYLENCDKLRLGTCIC